MTGGRPRRRPILQWAKGSSTSPKRLEASRSLREVLEASQRLGFVGPGSIDEHVDHGRRFATVLRDRLTSPAPLVADLGAGGGLPSLPMVTTEPSLLFVLVEASQRRCAFLVWAAVELGVADRIEVWCGRAEEFGHRVDRRSAFDAVVARGFGPPATTLECAAPLLVPGGRCVISEPPGGRSWSTSGIDRLGMTALEGSAGFAVFERTGPVGDRYPRSAKELKRDPLFVM